MADDKLNELAAVLEMRIALIADHGFRDRDPEGHLARLREVSGQIESLSAEIRPEVSPQLKHFLDNRSYQKALDVLRGLPANHSHQ